MGTIRSAGVGVSGWLKLHRQLQDNPLWLSEPFTRGQAWVDLMMLANYKASYMRVRGKKIDVPVGHVGRSQSSLAERWQWSRGKVIRFLEELKSDKQIEILTGHDFNVIKLCNYKQYQDESAHGGTRDSTRDGTRDESRDSTRNGTHNKKVRRKEGIEGKKTTPRSADADEGLLVDEIVIALPAKGGTSHDVTRSVVERYRENYPSLDVMNQLRSMRQHLEDNPHKRMPEWSCKTFISNWLNNRVADKSKAGVNTHGEFTPERYAIDEVARKFQIVGEGL